VKRTCSEQSESIKRICFRSEKARSGAFLAPSTRRQVQESKNFFFRFVDKFLVFWNSLSYFNKNNFCVAFDEALNEKGGSEKNNRHVHNTLVRGALTLNPS
jgi:hypothetical protein